MLAEIIAVGSEMLTPHRQDTNSLHITAALNDLGVSVAFKTIVGDNRQHLVQAIQIALARADILVLSGGLGPTEDDLTRECTAQALGIRTHSDASVLTALQDRFRARGLSMPPNNRKQADVLDGAEILTNANGSAPGQFLDTVFTPPGSQPFRKLVLLLPGPPKELIPLLDEHARPRLAAILPAHHLARRTLRLALLPESVVDARSAPIYSRFPDVETTILAGRGEIQLHFLCRQPTRQAAEQRVEHVADLVAREFGDDVFSLAGESLEEVVLLMLGLRGYTLSVAESCTGGGLAERLTSIPNSSRSFLGGLIPYSNPAKSALAGVSPELLDSVGAVSDPVARALAESVRSRCQSTFGLSITGIAGPSVPSGADAGKPVGLVYIGLADAEDTQVRKLNLTGDRDRIRLWATQHALELLRRRLL